MKVKLTEGDENARGAVISINSIPRVGEQLVMGANETIEVTRVTHTPNHAEHDAILTVKRVA